MVSSEKQLLLGCYGRTQEILVGSLDTEFGSTQGISERVRVVSF